LRDNEVFLLDGLEQRHLPPSVADINSGASSYQHAHGCHVTVFDGDQNDLPAVLKNRRTARNTQEMLEELRLSKLSSHLQHLSDLRARLFDTKPVP